MAINLNHKNHVISTSSTSPLKLIGTGLVLPISSAAEPQPGVITFNPSLNVARYWNGVKWVDLKSTEGITNKAQLGVASDIGLGSVNDSVIRFLSSSNEGKATWRRFEDEGILRFNQGDTKSISNHIRFDAQLILTGSISIPGFPIYNITTSAAQDLVPKGTVNSSVISEFNRLWAFYLDKYNGLVNALQELRRVILGAAVAEPPPPVPNPARDYSITYTDRVLGATESPNVLIPWVGPTVVNLNNGRVPGTWSRAITTYTYKKAEQYIAGMTPGSQFQGGGQTIWGTRYVDTVATVTFTWNGSVWSQ